MIIFNKSFFILGLMTFSSIFAESPLPSGMGQAPQRIEGCQERVLNTEALCRNFEEIKSSGISEDALKQAMTFSALSPYLNQKEIIVADYSKNSRENRLFRINLETGDVTKTKVSHGSGKLSNIYERFNRSLREREKAWGDENHDGMIDRCKFPDYLTRSWPQSMKEKYERHNMTRPGFFATKSPTRINRKTHWLPFHNGANAFPVQGLSEGINTDAEEEDVAFNIPNYNRGKEREGTVMGRGSYSPALTLSARFFFQGLSPNTVYYSYVPNCAEDMHQVYEQVPGWNHMCQPNSDHKFMLGCSKVDDRGRFAPEKEKDSESKSKSWDSKVIEL